MTTQNKHTPQETVIKPFSFMTGQEREEYILRALKSGTMFVEAPKAPMAILRG